jgi:hypothetical protein
MIPPPAREAGGAFFSPELPVAAVPAPSRFVFLGASNLAASLATAFERARRGSPGPVEMLAACGRGRSYGMASRYLFVRSLPGILAAGLWDEIGHRPPRPTFALLTDVGNDLVYGHSPERVAAWVSEALERLAGAEVALSLVPAANLEALPERRYRLLHALFYPLRPILPLAVLVERMHELNRRLAALPGARRIVPDPAWFGRDPIHWRRRAWPAVWEEMLGSQGTSEARDLPAYRRPILPELSAERLWLAGRLFENRQPVVRTADGSSLSLY